MPANILEGYLETDQPLCHIFTEGVYRWANIFHGHQSENKKSKMEKLTHLTTFDAVEQFGMWIPLQPHGTDYTLEENV